MAAHTTPNPTPTRRGAARNPRAASGVDRPTWPYPDQVRMTAAANGQWRWRCRGRDYYFGSWVDPESSPHQALRAWHRDRLAIEAGRDDARPSRAPSTVRSVASAFLDDFYLQVEQGQRAVKTYLDYRWTLKQFVRVVGAHTAWESLRPVDFATVMAEWRRQFSAHGRRKRINTIKTVANWAHAMYDLPKPAYGPSFVPPLPREIRKDTRVAGAKLHTPAELRRIVAAADADLRAMVLLGINAAMQPSDVATAPPASFDLASGWFVHTRQKTEEPRVVWLWPETVEAVRPFVAADRPYLWTSPSGNPLVHGTTNLISKRYRRLLRRLEVRGSFQWLRYTFRTWASQRNDELASRYVMGHVIDTDIHHGYLQEPPRQRIESLCRRVRRHYLEG